MAMYNAHRGMLPQHQMPNNRLTELLDQVRAEFEAQVGRQGEDQHQRESFSMGFPPCPLALKKLIVQQSIPRSRNSSTCASEYHNWKINIIR